MKTGIIGIIGFSLFLLCCEKGSTVNYLSKGTITGPDLRLCICCGGWQIVVDNQTYNFDHLPIDSPIDLEHETFPIAVDLDWQLSEKIKCPKWIDIYRIKKR
jgi:hypothetical protein